MDYQKGKVITDDFVIDEIIEKKNFLELILLKEENEKIRGLLKSNIDLFLRTFQVKDHVICKAKVVEGKDEIFLDIAYVKKYDLVTKKVDKSGNSDSKYIERFFKIIEDIKDKDYKELLNNFFEDEETKNLFFLSPGARNNHHNYEFGLLQHSVEVAEVSLLLAKYYGDMDLDLLATGALLHDIGKIKSYEFVKSSIIKTDWEHLLGHLSISALFISKMLPADFPAKKAMVLYHLVLSHHGKLEYGSPVEFKTKEARILNIADGLSLIINRVDRLTFTNHLSNFDELTKRFWYKE